MRLRVGGFGLLLNADSRRATVDMLGDWWKAPTDYQAQVEFFAKRSLTSLITLLIGLGVGMVGFIVMVAQFSSAESPNVPVRVVSTVFVVNAYVWTWVWWFGDWPSYRVSRLFIVNLDIGITVVTLANPKVLPGMFGLSALILVSFYVIFFGGPKVLALHSFWAVVSVTAMAVEISLSGGDDAVLAFSRILSGGALALAPVAAHFGIWALRNEAQEATSDPLTGLLNRRGLGLHIGDLLRSCRGQPSDVVVVVIDLDRFKGINDRYGHAAGDEVLVRCARRLESVVSSAALVARTGGEEFVVVDVLERPDSMMLADRIRSVLSDGDDEAPVTASVGMTDVPAALFVDSSKDHAELLGTLVNRADAAMFIAKRHGGDAVSYLPPAVDANR